jgi:predicted RNase H-like nuclease (RuvC/YqgF family)
VYHLFIIFGFYSSVYTYIIHHTNQSSSEYSQIYAQEKGQITSLNSSLFSLRNSVQSSITSLQQQNSDLNAKLEREKTSNNILKQKLGEKRGKELGALHLIVESKQSYNYQYVKNTTLLLADVFLFYLIYRGV